MCRAVGGDLYQCLPRVNGRYMFALGDVSGKGMPAALAMGAGTVLTGMLAEIDADLVDLAGHLHRQLFRSLTPEQFITMFLADLDAETGTIDYVNAGHEPPLIVRGDGSIDSLEPTGLPVGMIEDIMLEAGQARLEPGDLLAVFSDGVPEATIDGESFLGMDTVREILAAARDTPLADVRGRIVSAVDNFLAGEPNSDDVTLMLMRRKQIA